MEIVENYIKQGRQREARREAKLKEKEKEEINMIEINMISPADIIKDFYQATEYKTFGFNSYSSVYRKINDNAYVNCVVAYCKDRFGALFIIKSPRAHWAFGVRNRILGGYSHEVSEIDMKKCIEFLDNNPDSKILNVKEYERIKKLLLIARLR